MLKISYTWPAKQQPKTLRENEFFSEAFTNGYKSHEQTYPHTYIMRKLQQTFFSKGHRIPTYIVLERERERDRERERERETYALVFGR